MKKSNENQKKILAYLRECAQEGLPPSVREICFATGIKSTSTVHSHLKTLEKEGYIRREAGLNRAIHISKTRNLQVPIVARFNQDTLLFSKSDIEGYVSFTKPEFYDDIIAVRVFDESMKSHAILPGDVIFLTRSEKFSNDDMVVAIHKGSIIVRKVKTEGNVVCLESGNSRYIPVLLEDVKVIGKVIGLTRYY